MKDYSGDVLSWLRLLVGNEPFKDYYNTLAPDSGKKNSFALIDADTGQTFIISVEPGKIVQWLTVS